MSSPERFVGIGGRVGRGGLGEVCVVVEGGVRVKLLKGEIFFESVSEPCALAYIPCTYPRKRHLGQ